MKVSKNITVIIFFFATLGFFSINQLGSFIKDADYNENRQKASLPIFDINRLDDYPGKYELYLNDNFSLRGYFLKEMAIINTKLWKKSPKPDKVIMGKEGWLFNVDKDLDTYLGKRKFSNDELEAVLAEFVYRKKVLDSMGIEMCILINPVKYDIYPEYLPRYLQGNKISSNADQLVSIIKQHTDINIIYTKDILLKHKKDGQLYYKYDNHWNYFAAYYVDREFLKTLNVLKGVDEIPLGSFCYDTLFSFKGSLANMTGNPSSYLENRIRISLCEDDAESFARITYPPVKDYPYPQGYQESFRSNKTDRPNALIIMDSFGCMTFPYIKNTFHYSTFIFDAWRYRFNRDIIKKEKPDVVIYMILESMMPNLYKHGRFDVKLK